MDKIYDKCRVIDVHKKIIVACFRQGGRQEINESAKRRKPGKMRKGNVLLWTTLITCVVHSMVTAIYHILKDGVDFKDFGADYYNQFNRERKVNAYLKKLKALCWEVPVVTA